MMKLIATFILSIAMSLNGLALTSYEVEHQEDMVHSGCCQELADHCCETSCSEEGSSQGEHSECGHCQKHCFTCQALSIGASAMTNQLAHRLPVPVLESLSLDFQRNFAGTSYPPTTPPPKRSV